MSRNYSIHGTKVYVNLILTCWWCIILFLEGVAKYGRLKACNFEKQTNFLKTTKLNRF